MFYGDNISETRQHYFTSWKKYQQKLPLLPLESQIVDIIKGHPEYFYLFEDQEKYQNKVYDPNIDHNPFLHLSLHMAVREQVSTDRPIGIKKIYKRLVKKYKSSYEAEHQLMTALANCLNEANVNGKVPDDETYFNEYLKQGRL